MTASAKCGARLRQGEGTCKLAAGAGTDHPGIGCCRFHGGNTQTHRAAAARIAGERMAESLAIEPHEALLANLAAWNGIVAYFTDAVRELENVIVDYRKERRILSDADVEAGKVGTLVQVDTSNEARLHILVAERQTALVERGKAAKLCVEAKVDERIADQAERDGAAFAAFAKELLDGFGLTGDPRSPEVVRRAFRVLEGGQAA